MSLIGKFAIERSRWSSVANIYRVDGETEKTLTVTQWIERANGEKYFHDRATRALKDRFVAFVDTLHEARQRVERAKDAHDAMEPKLKAARQTLREIEAAQDEIETLILKGGQIHDEEG